MEICLLRHVRLGAGPTGAGGTSLRLLGFAAGAVRKSKRAGSKSEESEYFHGFCFFMYQRRVLPSA